MKFALALLALAARPVAAADPAFVPDALRGGAAVAADEAAPRGAVAVPEAAPRVRGGDAAALAVGCPDGYTCGDNSCRGIHGTRFTRACQGTRGNIGVNSCVGGQACQFARGDIADNSCFGDMACLNAHRASWYTNANDSGSITLDGDIGSNSCRGQHACRKAPHDIGNWSCRGENACYLGDRATPNHDALHGLTIGSNSCHGNNACRDIAVNVGQSSCYGNNACRDIAVDIGRWSCRGDDACRGYTGSAAIPDYCHIIADDGETCLSSCGFFRTRCRDGSCVSAWWGGSCPAAAAPALAAAAPAPGGTAGPVAPAAPAVADGRDSTE